MKLSNLFWGTYLKKKLWDIALGYQNNSVTVIDIRQVYLKHDFKSAII